MCCFSIKATNTSNFPILLTKSLLSRSPGQTAGAYQQLVSLEERKNVVLGNISSNLEADNNHFIFLRDFHFQSVDY